jgi:hypothetical protein
MQLHPDKCKSNTDYLFKTLTQAYKYLLKEYEKKKNDKQYDELRAESRKVLSDNNYDGKMNNLGSGNNFNIKKFNKVFEKTRLEDPVMESGYGSWMQKSSSSREDIHVKSSTMGNSRNFDMAKFNDVFEKETLKNGFSSKIIIYEEPEAMEISKKIQFSELGVTKLDDFSGENITNKKLQYTDYKVAHTTSRLAHPSFMKDKGNVVHNIEDFKNQRANVSHVMNAEELKKYNSRIALEQKKEKERLNNLEEYNRRVEQQFKSVHHLLASRTQ